MELNEGYFLALFREDKDKAFYFLVDTYSAQIYNVCFNLLLNKEDAEDMTQEVFTAVYLSLDTYRGNSKISTWMYSIALNKSKEFLRHKTRKKRSGISTQIDRADSHSVPDQAVEFKHPGVQLEDKERAQILFAALNRLSDNQREAYILHKIEGVSYGEIAEVMNVSLSSVESLMFRAKQRLQELLRDYYEKNES